MKNAREKKKIENNIEFIEGEVTSKQHIHNPYTRIINDDFHSFIFSLKFLFSLWKFSNFIFVFELFFFFGRIIIGDSRESNSCWNRHQLKKEIFDLVSICLCGLLIVLGFSHLLFFFLRPGTTIIN